MIYKIKTWKFKPVVSEVFISASNDQECLEIFNSINYNTLSWKECPMTNHRTTYEVVKSDEQNS